MKTNSANQEKQYFYFLRHSETDWNKTARLNSFTDLELSEGGVKECEKLAQIINHNNIYFSRIISSPMKRTIQTARIINQKNNDIIKIDNSLKELNFGSFEGKSAVEILNKNKSELFKKWQSGENVPEIGGEKWCDVEIRAKKIIKKYILDKKINLDQKRLIGNKILIVGHGYFLRILTCLILGLSCKDYSKFRLDNLNFVVFEVSGKNIKLIAFNVKEIQNIKFDVAVS